MSACGNAGCSNESGAAICVAPVPCPFAVPCPAAKMARVARTAMKAMKAMKATKAMKTTIQSKVQDALGKLGNVIKKTLDGKKSLHAKGPG